jgi:hypothetical protein
MLKIGDRIRLTPECCSIYIDGPSLQKLVGQVAKITLSKGAQHGKPVVAELWGMFGDQTYVLSPTSVALT